MKGALVADHVARDILVERTGKSHFAHTDTNEILSALRAEYPGHLIPGLLVERERMIAEETERVKEVIAHIVRVVDLAQIELCDRPEAGP